MTTSAGFRSRSLIRDGLHAAAGILSGIWLPMVLARMPQSQTAGLCGALDLTFMLLGVCNAGLAWRPGMGALAWVGLLRNLAVALPLWTLLHGTFVNEGWLWLFKALTLGSAFRLTPLLARVEKLPPSAGRLLALVVGLPMAVWWVAAGWIRLGGDPEILDPELRLARAIYWAVTTMATVGYGDIVPQTPGQMFYACAVMVTGVAAFGYILSNIASLTLRLDTAKQHQESLRERVEYFMQYHKIPKELRHRVRDYFRYLWSSRHGYNDAEVFESLPRNLRADLAMHIYNDLLTKVPLFREASPSLHRDLVLSMRPQVATPGEVLFRQGDYGEELFFVLHGEVEILDAHGESLARLSDGSFFGEMALLNDRPRNATARAAGFCDLYVLDRDSFHRVLTHHPEFQQTMDAVARDRQN